MYAVLGKHWKAKQQYLSQNGIKSSIDAESLFCIILHCVAIYINAKQGEMLSK